ncbi:hypothetical protein ACHAXR_013168 [Thalassiosira sp. AJA248-18]
MNTIRSSYRPKRSQPRRIIAATSSSSSTSPTPIPPMSAPISLASSNTLLKKPMRPLTAYHIFFQIEREYLIQTAAGPDADTTIHDNKSYIDGVPRRYRCTKLLTDWYAGPGKRQKRKHRKSHGKIGFLELSRLISKRWATLNTTDPETKRYVAKIAARELDGYKVEMEEYKVLMEARLANASPETPKALSSSSPSSVLQPPVVQPAVQTADEAAAPAAATIGAMISPSTSPSPTFDDGPATTHDTVSSSSSSSYASHYVMPPTMNMMQYCQPISAPSSSSSYCQPISSTQETSSFENEIDYSICRKDKYGHYIPSSGPSTMAWIHPDESSICDPLFELDDGNDTVVNKPNNNKKKNRCVSPSSLNNNDSMNVDLSRDDDDFWLRLLTY